MGAAESAPALPQPASRAMKQVADAAGIAVSVAHAALPPPAKQAAEHVLHAAMSASQFAKATVVGAAHRATARGEQPAPPVAGSSQPEPTTTRAPDVVVQVFECVASDPVWRAALLHFIDSNCELYTSDEENAHEHAEVHAQFCLLYERMLTATLQKLKIGEAELVAALRQGRAAGGMEATMLLDMVEATDDFLSFKAMMVARHYWILKARELRTKPCALAAADAEAWEVTRAHLHGMQRRMGRALAPALFASELDAGCEGDDAHSAPATPPSFSAGRTLPLGATACGSAWGFPPQPLGSWPPPPPPPPPPVSYADERETPHPSEPPTPHPPSSPRPLTHTDTRRTAEPGAEWEGDLAVDTAEFSSGARAEALAAARIELAGFGWLAGLPFAADDECRGEGAVIRMDRADDDGDDADDDADEAGSALGLADDGDSANGAGSALNTADDEASAEDVGSVRGLATVTTAAASGPAHPGARGVDEQPPLPDARGPHSRLGADPDEIARLSSAWPEVAADRQSNDTGAEAALTARPLARAAPLIVHANGPDDDAAACAQVSATATAEFSAAADSASAELSAEARHEWISQRAREALSRRAAGQDACEARCGDSRGDDGDAELDALLRDFVSLTRRL